MRSFHNTIDYTGELLLKAEQNARKQEDKILIFFVSKPGERFTPFEIQKAVLPYAPVTSVRRAMTNLTTKGYLIKTDDQKLEEWGKHNYLWKLANIAKALNYIREKENG